ncbi:MAG: glycosyltransferase family 2 protein [Desulfovibrionaceae bacterium]|nr:glycosyltransferase family 2 protein [Desulfovibrionaceae bacterium]
MPIRAQVSIIIPALNKWNLTRDCLRSLREHSPLEDCEIIVVDNGSADATATELEPLGQGLFGERFQRLRHEENHNFGPACNLGAEAASAPLLFFLNNDTLCSPGWLPPLLEALREENGPAAVGPLLLYPDGRVQHLGVGFALRTVSHLYQGYPRSHPVVDKKRHLRALSAAALLLPKDLFHDCGAFCEEYRNGFEDVDLSLQIVSRGHRLRCVSQSAIFHLESQTPGRSTHERHNGEILLARCRDLLASDLHLHALRDGLKPTLDDALGLSVLLSEVESARLSAGSRKESPAWMQEQLTANPGWLLGARLLSKTFEKQGQTDAALHYAMKAAEIHATFETFGELLRLSRMAGHAEITAQAEATLKDFTNLYDGERPAITLLLARHQKEASSDPALLRLLENKKTEIDRRLAKAHSHN